MTRHATVGMLAVLVVSVGCGRVAFESMPDASDASTDAVDAMAACVGDFLVDTAADDPGQACQGAGCSLRAAVALANAQPSSTICVADGLSIQLATALTITAGVTIAGAGTSAICGAGSDRVFHVAAGGVLELRDLTVCHGRLTDDEGAGVLVDADAALDADRVVFDDHVVVSDVTTCDGGAIRANANAVVQIRRSRFTNNRVTVANSTTAYARGGALAIQEGATAATLVIEDTAFEGNTTQNVGGALYLALDGTHATLNRLLFARNSSDTGSAIDINCASTGAIAVDSSTFVDNTTTATTGASVIYVCGAETLRLSFCSFRGNKTELVRFGAITGRAELRANAITTGGLDLCFGPGTGKSLDGNITDRDDTVCPMTSPNDRLLDVMFGLLGDNGGPTQTLALSPTSPAIDAAGASCPAVDQRGRPRPVGAACDAGAFEVQ